MALHFFVCNSLTLFSVAIQGFIRLDMSEYQEKHEVRFQEVFALNAFDCHCSMLNWFPSIA